MTDKCLDVFEPKFDLHRCRSETNSFVSGFTTFRESLFKKWHIDTFPFNVCLSSSFVPYHFLFAFSHCLHAPLSHCQPLCEHCFDISSLSPISSRHNSSFSDAVFVRWGVFFLVFLLFSLIRPFMQKIRITFFFPSFLNFHDQLWLRICSVLYCSRFSIVLSKSFSLVLDYHLF